MCVCELLSFGAMYVCMYMCINISPVSTLKISLQTDQGNISAFFGLKDEKGCLSSKQKSIP